MEGKTDRGVIAGLMEANGVPWPRPPASPVFIDARGSVDEILKPEVLKAELGASGLEAPPRPADSARRHAEAASVHR